MSRVVLLIEHSENRRLLAEWLAQEHTVVIPDPEAPQELQFDLGIVDGPSLERYGPWIDAVKRAVSPLMLPFLLVTQHRGAGVATGNAWEHVDELILSPVEKVELHARVETLLRARALSVANASLRQRLERELERAREVQVRLLPSRPPVLRGFELAARCVPALEVGGDFYDWEAEDGTAVLSVGDVMGKGVPAALLAATVRAVLRALAHLSTPGPTLDLLGQTLRADLERTSSFATLFHARVAIRSREIQYVDAGHGHALVRRADGRLERLERGGRPIGFPPPHRYLEKKVRLGRGDVLFVYSDGLCDGIHERADQLMATVDVAADASKIVDQIVSEAPRSGAIDDLTVLALKCTS
jgi:hypothetical protein